MSDSNTSADWFEEEAREREAKFNDQRERADAAERRANEARRWIEMSCAGLIVRSRSCERARLRATTRCRRC